MNAAAPEFFSGGAKLLALPGAGAKLAAAAVLQLITRRDDLHFPQAAGAVAQSVHRMGHALPASGDRGAERGGACARRARCTWTARALPMRWRRCPGLRRRT